MNPLSTSSQIKFDQNKVLFDKNPVKSNFTEYMAETFGQWLERKRNAAGLNQTELAARSRVTKATISLYEQDRVEQPRPKQLVKIAKALGVSIEEIRDAASQRSKPQNLEQLLEILEHLGVENLHLSDHDRFRTATPDELQEVLDAVQLAVAVTLQRQKVRPNAPTEGMSDNPG